MITKLEQVTKSAEFSEVNIDQRTVEGWMVRHGNVDSDGDIFTKGSFANKEEFVQKGFVFPDHDIKKEPLGLGFIKSVEELDGGVWVKVQLYDTEASNDILTKIKTRLENDRSVGFSIGGYIEKHEIQKSTGHRLITSFIGKEVSIVAFPANDMAHLLVAKSSSGEAIDAQQEEKNQKTVETNGNIDLASDLEYEIARAEAHLKLIEADN